MNKTISLYALLLIIILLTGCAAANVVPAFKITTSDLEKVTAALPAEIQQTILKQPAGFLDLMVKIMDEPQWILAYVDKTHALPVDYEPPDLVLPDAYGIKVLNKQMQLSKTIISPLKRMTDRAKEENIELVIASAYRSFESQEQVYAYWVKTLGQQQADKESARPGHSQHQLGTTFDLNPIDPAFATTKAGKWVLQNAGEFGFSLSYPDGYTDLTGYIYEPWHFRYLGIPAVTMINSYFNGIQQHFLMFYNEHHAFFKERRKSVK